MLYCLSHHGVVQISHIATIVFLFRKVFHSSEGNVMKAFPKIPWMQRPWGNISFNKTPFFVLFYAQDNNFPGENGMLLLFFLYL